MIRSLYTAATGMEAQQLNLDITANNLANVSTAGFKKSRVDFQDLLYQTIRSAGATQAQGVQVPTGSPGRSRHAGRRDPEDVHSRRYVADWQPAGRGHRGQRVLPGPASVR